MNIYEDPLPFLYFFMGYWIKIFSQTLRKPKIWTATSTLLLVYKHSCCFLLICKNLSLESSLVFFDQDKCLRVIKNLKDTLFFFF